MKWIVLLNLCFFASTSAFSQKMEFIKPNTSFYMDTLQYQFSGEMDKGNRGYKSFQSRGKKDSVFYLSIDANNSILGLSNDDIDSFFNEKRKHLQGINSDSIRIFNVANVEYKGFRGLVFQAKYKIDGKMVFTADLVRSHKYGFNKIFMTETLQPNKLRNLKLIIDNIAVYSETELATIYNDIERKYSVSLVPLPLKNWYTWGDLNEFHKTTNIDSVPLEVLAYCKESRNHAFNNHHVFRGELRIEPKLDLEIINIEVYGPVEKTGYFSHVLGDKDTFMYVEKGIKPGDHTRYCRLLVRSEIGLIVPITFKLSFTNELDYFYAE